MQDYAGIEAKVVLVIVYTVGECRSQIIRLDGSDGKTPSDSHIQASANGSRKPGPGTHASRAIPLHECSG